MSVVLAARSALRVLPALDAVLHVDMRSTVRIASEIVLPVFRATTLAWVAARYPAFGALNPAW